ncbi:MAG: EamA family transporter [Candidatus Woesearchaeota archaeon]
MDTTGLLLAFGLLVGFGVYPVIVKRLSMRYGSLTTSFYSHLIVTLAVAAIFLPRVWPFFPDHGSLLITLFLGLLGAAIICLMFNIYKESDISVSMPLIYLHPVLTVSLALVIFNEPLSLIQKIAAITAAIGALILITDFRNLSSGIRSLDSRLLIKIIILIVMFSANALIAKVLVTRIGGGATALYLQSATFIFVFLFSARKLVIPLEKDFKHFIASGAFISLAICCLFLAIEKIGIALTSAFNGSSALIGVLLGMIFFKERVKPRQWIGIIVVVLGLIALAVG